MILSALTTVRSPDERTAWSSLQRFQNVASVTDLMVALHALPPGQRKNAQKQAKQIRYCLMQAREYAAAARVVSLVTKPTLLYYAVMNLALAEVLLKQSGDFSLDRAREHHRHHGLLFSDTRSGPLSDELTVSASGLFARPMVLQREAEEERLGTFELWHRGAREAPYVGKYTNTHEGGGQTSGTEILAGPDDIRMPLLNQKGLTLLDCLTHIPDMLNFVNSYGIRSNCARGAMVREDFPERSVLRFVLHPSDIAHEVFESLEIHPNLVDRLNYIPLPSGGVITINSDPVNNSCSMRLPPGAATSTTEFRCWLDRKSPLNEFGYIYVALFIAGNYARYYPDRWVADVENSAPIALAIEELLSIAERRVPWATLSELSRSYHVFSD
ncbi:YaaC family protein [Bradyrhizobium tunisiense]|uniref:YaaC family protein n=1 Tax=Bradyrhizobium tunisiense TaxID=3278709 RepID=UPI0035DC5989